MTVLFEPILALHIINPFKIDEIIGGGGRGTICLPPPPIFSWRAATAPQLPQDRRLWGQGDLDEQGGDVYSGGSRICKKGVGGKILCALAHRARESCPHTGGVQGPARRAPGGVQGQSPCRGPRGRSPRKALEFSANKGLQDGRQE